MSKAGTYHHGNLADTLITTTARLIEHLGVAQLSLRQVAREAQVSHGAPAHHFKDKKGLLTAVAIKGHELLMQDLLNAKAITQNDSGERLIKTGEAYIRFAVKQTGYFSVMFHPELVNIDDSYYQQVCNGPRQLLKHCIKEHAKNTQLKVSAQRLDATVLALWSQAHGFANLWLAGNLGEDEKLFEKLLQDTLTSIMPRWED